MSVSLMAGPRAPGAVNAVVTAAGPAMQPGPKAREIVATPLRPVGREQPVRREPVAARPYRRTRGHGRCGREEDGPGDRGHERSRRDDCTIAHCADEKPAPPIFTDRRSPPSSPLPTAGTGERRAGRFSRRNGGVGGPAPVIVSR